MMKEIYSFQNKKINNYKLKRNNGITLISLTVTIIILLILSGITITTLKSKNGVITNAQKAKSETAYNSAKDEAKLEVSNLTLYGQSNSLDTKKLALEASRDLGTANNNKTGWSEVKYSENTIYVKNVNSSIKKDNSGLQNGEAIFKFEINGDIVVFNGEIASNSDEYKNATPAFAVNENIKLGDNVYYESKSHKNETTISKDYYGNNEAEETLTTGSKNEYYNKDQVLQYSKFKNTSWKVWNINKEDGTIELISKEPIWQEIELIGSNGYNNGPKILNDVCSDFYSDTSRNIIARSVDLKDIEVCYNTSVENVAKSNNTKYGNEITTKGIYNLNYLPIVYGTDENIIITDKQKNDLRANLNDEYISSKKDNDEIATKTNRNSITLKNTSYILTKSDYNKFINESERIDMITKPSWLASRYIKVNDDNTVSYCLYGLYSNGLNNYGMTGTTGYSNGYTSYLRPIVTLDSSVKITKGLLSWKVNDNS